MRGEAFVVGPDGDQLHFRACGRSAGTCRHAVFGTPLTRQATAATTLPMQTASVASIHAQQHHPGEKGRGDDDGAGGWVQENRVFSAATPDGSGQRPM